MNKKNLSSLMNVP